ncbi:MAG TPA: universal stress protein [Usitatibacter sp.]|nr:universal stress protein [Usitatibacter sp.]
MYKHILVPTDGTPLSRKAVRAAAQLASTMNAQVTAVHVMQPWDPPAGAEAAAFQLPRIAQEYDRHVRATAKTVLDEVASDVKAPCETVAVFDSHPWEAIVKVAAERKCDVIVMASHGRGGLAGLLLGSETQKVLTHSKTPVLVCR